MSLVAYDASSDEEDAGEPAAAAAPHPAPIGPQPRPPSPTAVSPAPRPTPTLTPPPPAASQVQLAGKLKISKTDQFDSDAYVQSKCCAMDEKEVRHLCSYLQDLKKTSAEVMRRSVRANYVVFIKTSKEISDLEGKLLSVRNLPSTQSALIHGLSEGVQIDSLVTGPEGSVEQDISGAEDQKPSKIWKWSVAPISSSDVSLPTSSLDLPDVADLFAPPADNASRKRESNGSALHDSRNKFPRMQSQSQGIGSAAGNALIPPQLRGRSNVVTEDMSKLFVAKRKE
ncbi:Exocyst complex component EXO84B [Zea mays]|uniref:Exocyst complex component EXO84B n=2 Tax=Zea mays TaxID=4577 RepID=A0A3L6FQN3_MAIZE|nr:Exocyst complex component EXO84B [Zea mays]